MEGRWGDPRPSTNHDSSLKLGCQWGCRSVWPRARFSLHFITEKPPPSSGKVEAHLSTPAQARQRFSFRQIGRNDQGDRLNSEIQLFHLFSLLFFFLQAFFTHNRSSVSLFVLVQFLINFPFKLFIFAHDIWFVIFIYFCYLLFILFITYTIFWFLNIQNIFFFSF